MADAGQIKVIGTSTVKRPLYPLVSKDSYVCANTQIVKGFTSAPDSLEYCLQSFPGIKKIAQIIGITRSSDLWTGISGSTYYQDKTNDIYLGTGYTAGGAFGPSEMELVLKDTILGKDWLGCYWPAPEAPFSTNCPDINDKYEGYLKLRLNVATFWNTPKETPVKRREFLDSLKYARKSNIVIAGDFNIKVGDVIYVKIDNLSGYPYSTGPSVLSDYYWVLGVKNTITNSGTHETMLKISQILPTSYEQGNVAGGGSGTEIPDPYSGMLSGSGTVFNMPSGGSPPIV